MMKRLAFAIQKGGTGKTTLSGNVAGALSRDRKVALIDCDPQASLTSWLVEDPPDLELADALVDTRRTGDALVERGGFWMIPTFGVDGALQAFADNQLDDMPFVFDDLCQALEASGFEVAIFDLSPGFGRLEKRILAVMQEVITPLTPEYFGLDGIEIFAHALADLRKNFRSQVRHRVIVANMMNRSFRRHTAYHGQLEDLDYQLYTVSQDSKLSEAQTYHQTIFEYAPRSRSVPDLERLAEIAGGDHGSA